MGPLMSGASLIQTASYRPRVMNPWWILIPIFDAASIIILFICSDSCLVGAFFILTSVMNHIVAALCRTLYIRRHQDFLQIEEFGEVEVGGALRRLRVLPGRVPRGPVVGRLPELQA